MRIFSMIYIVLFFSILILQNRAFCQTEFLNALKTCENFTQEGSIEKNNELYNLKITLKKLKNDKCQYREKITQAIQEQTLICNFNKEQIYFITNSMLEFYKAFPKEIAKNKIFEAKLSTNGVIFQKYLIDKNYCTIEQLKRK